MDSSKCGVNYSVNSYCNRYVQRGKCSSNQIEFANKMWMIVRVYASGTINSSHSTQTDQSYQPSKYSYTGTLHIYKSSDGLENEFIFPLLVAGLLATTTTPYTNSLLWPVHCRLGLDAHGETVFDKYILLLNKKFGFTNLLTL